MNTTPAEGVELARDIVKERRELPAGVELIVCPPFTHLSEVMRTVRGAGVAVGAQNCASEAWGAYTGEVSAGMIASLGVEYVILGHSERREYFGEGGEALRRKMALALENNLSPIYCVGEKLDDREAGRQEDVVGRQIEEVLFELAPEQLRNIIVAYEPVWAIGTGRTASAEQAQQMHAFIRERLGERFGAAAQSMPILYGGSMKPSNARELLAQPDVDGGLIGGASLKAAEFIDIARSFS